MLDEKYERSELNELEIIYNEYLKEIGTYDESELEMLVGQIMEFQEFIDENDINILQTKIYRNILFNKEERLNNDFKYCLDNVFEYIRTNYNEIVSSQIVAMVLPTLYTNNFYSYLKSTSMIMGIILSSYLLVSSYLISDFRKRGLKQKLNKVNDELIKLEDAMDTFLKYKECYVKILNFATKKLISILPIEDEIKKIAAEDDIICEIELVNNAKSKNRKRKK